MGPAPPIGHAAEALHRTPGFVLPATKRWMDGAHLTVVFVIVLLVSYRAEKKSLQILLSSTQAGPGGKVKEEQEDISHNHVPGLFLSSVEV